MKSHLKYLQYVLKHKWYVLLECVKLGVPLWGALVHDWQKFTPAEWGPYVKSFYGPHKYEDRPPELVKAFDRSWLHHQHKGPHHWQYWLGCSIIIGNRTHANDDEKGLCKCLNFKKKTPKPVRDADKNCLERNLDTEGKSGDSAKDAILKKQSVIVKTIGKHIKRIKPNIWQKKDIRKNNANTQMIEVEDIENKLLNVMGALHQVVLVAANRIMSFWPLTTLMGVGRNTEKNIPGDWVELEHINGQSRTNSLPSSRYYAITATHHLDTTDIVPIRKTNLLMNDDGLYKCLDCGKIASKNNIFVLEMPDRYRREMLADWNGAGLAISSKNDTKEYYKKRRDIIILHERTREWIERML